VQARNAAALLVARGERRDEMVLLAVVTTGPRRAWRIWTALLRGVLLEEISVASGRGVSLCLRSSRAVESRTVSVEVGRRHLAGKKSTGLPSRSPLVDG